MSCGDKMHKNAKLAAGTLIFLPSLSKVMSKVGKNIFATRSKKGAYIYYMAVILWHNVWKSPNYVSFEFSWQFFLFVCLKNSNTLILAQNMRLFILIFKQSALDKIVYLCCVFCMEWWLYRPLWLLWFCHRNLQKWEACEDRSNGDEGRY